MSIADAIFLFAAGFLSGVVNAIAGGGTFLTFGAMTLVGLPPIVANATSSITQFPGYVTSVLAYRDEIRSDWREARLLGALSLVGGLAGALLLLSLSNPSFRALVPWLLLGATLIFAAGPYLKPKRLSPEKPIAPLGLAGQFVTAIYGGFFGAGMGIMTLAVLGLTKGGDYHRLNALKNFLAVVVAAMAIVVFASGNVVGWPQAAVMIPAGALGGYCGVWAARRVPQPVIRGLVVAVGFALTVYYFVSG
ncbi:sulfite exporter TauE/SafE family protein [Rhizobium sp. TRM95111]|uniref:sulfite exporter TauE/SafE family protein n=1 Tax=Rhizobium alarense TaxID=2846851 RepID=UPI001F23C150|nr:sulfite exporter TauE/SafE family protein [Rhizobium alarense]MCF3641301.1 sulfite exporter TauE/SafE family protein [Rhizobium alarense]